MADDFFDFGFTAVDEDELEAVQQSQLAVQQTASTATQLEGEVSRLQDKIDNLYNAVIPLLSNLKKSPEKSYILWPNRTEKIEQFEDHLRSILKS